MRLSPEHASVPSLRLHRPQLTARRPSERGRRLVSASRPLSVPLLSAGHFLGACISHQTFMLALLTRHSRAVHLLLPRQSFLSTLLVHSHPARGAKELPSTTRYTGSARLHYPKWVSSHRHGSAKHGRPCQKAHQAGCGNGVWRSALHGTSAVRAVGAGSWVCSLASGHVRTGSLRGTLSRASLKVCTLACIIARCFDVACVQRGISVKQSLITCRTRFM